MTDKMINGRLAVTESLSVESDSEFKSNLHIVKNLQVDGACYGFGNLKVNGPLTIEDSIHVAGNGFFGGHVGIGNPNETRHPFKIRSNGRSEELMGFENADGAIKWHINQNLGGTRDGLNFVESGVKDGRLFLKAGGNVGIGTTKPLKPLHIRSDQRNPIIIENSWANTKGASALLNSLPKLSLVVGGPWSNRLYFYWKDENNKKYVGTLTGQSID